FDARIDDDIARTARLDEIHELCKARLWRAARVLHLVQILTPALLVQDVEHRLGGKKVEMLQKWRLEFVGGDRRGEFAVLESRLQAFEQFHLYHRLFLAR